MLSTHDVEQLIKEMEREIEVNKPIDIVEFALYLLNELEKENIQIKSRSKMMWVLFFIHAKYMHYMKKPIPLFRNLQVGRINFYSKDIFENFSEEMFFLVTPKMAKELKNYRKNIGELLDSISIMNDAYDIYLEDKDDINEKIDSEIELKKITMKELIEWAKEYLKAPDYDLDRRRILTFHEYFREKLDTEKLVEIDNNELYEEIQKNELFFEFDYVWSLLEYKVSFTTRTLKKRG